MQISEEIIMTRPYAIIGSALTAAVINVSVALALMAAPAPKADQTEPHARYHSAPLYQLSPIPAGADWDRS
jgi:hypothetical protein